MHTSKASRKDFQGQNFRNQDLTGYDFSNADIRGADFTNAILRGANFTEAVAGIPKNKLRYLLSLAFGLIFVVFVGLFFYFFLVSMTGLWYFIQTPLPFDSAPHYSPILGFHDLSKLLLYILILIGFYYQGLSVSALRNIFIFCATYILVDSLLWGFGLSSSSGASSPITFIEQVYGNYGFLANIIGIGSAVVLPLIMSIMNALIVIIILVIVQVFLAIPLFIIQATTTKKVVVKQSDPILTTIFSIIIYGVFIWIGIWIVAEVYSSVASNLVLPGKGSIFIATLFTFDFSLKLLSILAVMITAQFYTSYYIANSAILGKKKFELIKNLGVELISRYGTAFKGADLTEANFSYSTVKNSDLRQTSLMRTIWFKSKDVHLNYLQENCYLNDSQLLQLATTMNGESIDFSRKNLRGVSLRDANLKKANLASTDLSEANLEGADLSEANLTSTNLENVNLRSANLKKADFTGADLHKANLEGADLFQARLVSTNLDRTNFTRANLTGAFIENWGAKDSTNLEQLECDYIHMKVPVDGQLDPNRMPPTSKGNFSAGEFEKFAKSLIGTLALYHRNDFDPRAVVIALSQLAEEFEGDFTIVALESKGDGQVVVKVQKPEEVDPTLAENKYYPAYQKIRELLPTNSKMVPKPFKTFELAANNLGDSAESGSTIVKILVSAKTAYVGYAENGDVNMDNREYGDKFENITGSTVVNKSIVEASFNKVKDEHDADTANAIKEIANEIEKSGNKEAAELFESFNEELQKPQPKRSVLRTCWNGIIGILPSLAELAEAVAKISGLFS